ARPATRSSSSSALLDEIEGDPDLEDEPAEPDLSTFEKVSQIVLNGDDREDDDDGEPSLAVPEVRHWDSQERIWGARAAAGYAMRSLSRTSASNAVSATARTPRVSERATRRATSWRRISTRKK